MTYEIDTAKPWQSLLRMHETHLPKYLYDGWRTMYPDSDPVADAYTMYAIEEGKKKSKSILRWHSWLVGLCGFLLIPVLPVVFVATFKEEPLWTYVCGIVLCTAVVAALGLAWWSSWVEKSVPSEPNLDDINELYFSLFQLLELTDRTESGFGGMFPFPGREKLVSLVHEQLVRLALEVRRVQQVEREDDSGHPSEELMLAADDLESLYFDACNLDLIRNPRDSDFYHDYYAEADSMVAQP